jgi:hypothetical protein
MFGHRVCETNGVCFFFVWICVLGVYFYGSYVYGESLKAETAKERLVFLAGRNNETKAARKKQ